MLGEDWKARLREFWLGSFSRVDHPKFASNLKIQPRWFNTGTKTIHFDAPKIPGYAGHSTDVVRLEINVDKLCRLLECHQLFATDFRCLDRSSKNCIRRLFLHACAKSLSSNKPIKQ
jgi:hypothetical protein